MTASRTDQQPDPWPAPLSDGPLQATVHLPGSKSLTNRYLVLAAVADGPGSLRGALLSRDTLLMAAALRALGVEIDTDPSTALVTVRPGPLRAHGTVDAGLAGTVMRFLPPLAALATGTVTVDGDPQATARPMAPLLQALRELGVTVHGDAVPFTITGTGAVDGGGVDIDASASSQFVSGLLLAAPRYRRGLTVRHTGSGLPSLPHIEMTVAVLREAGVAVDDSRPGVWRVSPGPVAAMDVRIEPDLSNAGPFLAAALVAGGTVRVPGWPQVTTQPGDLLRDLLGRMGGTVKLSSDGVLSVTGTGVVHGIDVDLHAAGELAPTVAAAAALADSPTRLRGIGHLRGHETDRLAALATEITALGGRAEQTADGLAITPGPLRGGLVRTYHDHRLATAAALIGLRVPGVLVQDVATTDKTLPGFAALWHGMLGR